MQKSHLFLIFREIEERQKSGILKLPRLSNKVTQPIAASADIHLVLFRLIPQ